MKIILILFVLSQGSWAATGLSQRTYDRLQQAQQLLAEHQFKAAIDRLKKLAEQVQKRPYDYAVVMQNLAYAQANRENYAAAIQAFEAALAKKVLPDKVQQSIRYDLAQLYAITAKWRSARLYYEQWSKQARQKNVDQLLLGAQIYAQIRHYRRAISLLKQAVRQKRRRDLYEFLLGLYLETQQYANAAQLLKKMIRYWNKAVDWQQLAQLYLIQKKYLLALTVLELLHKQNALSNQDYQNLISLYLMQGAPYRAARALEKAMQQGKLPKNRQNQQWLAQIWLQAKEIEQAIAHLEQSAQTNEDYLELANFYFHQQNWQKVIAISQRLLKLKPSGSVYLLKGLAEYELQQWSAARRSLQAALDDPNSRASAQTWLNLWQWLEGTSITIQNQ